MTKHKKIMLIMLLTIYSLTGLKAQELKKVYSFDYFMLNFKEYSSAYLYGDGMFIRYSSGPGVSSPQQTVALINKYGKIIEIPDADYNRNSDIRIDGDQAYCVGITKGKFDYKEYNFSSGTVSNMFTSEKIADMIEKSGARLKGNFSHSLSYIDVIDKENLLVLIRADHDFSYFTLLFKFNLTEKRIEPVVPGSYPEVKKDRVTEIKFGDEWSYHSYNDERIFYMLKTFEHDEKRKHSGEVVYNIATYDFNGRLKEHFKLKANDIDGDIVRDERMTDIPSHLIYDKKESAFYTIAFTKVKDDVSCWLRKFDEKGNMLSGEKFPLGNDKDALIGIKRSSVYSFTLNNKLLQFKSFYTSKRGIDMKWRSSDLKPATDRNEQALNEKAGIPGLMDEINKEISRNNDLKFEEDYLFVMNKKAYVMLKGKGRSYNVYMYREE